MMDAGIKGQMWVAKATMPANDEANGVQDVVCQAVDELSEGIEGGVKYTRPGVKDIEVEWTGYRSNASASEPLPNVSEEEKYKRLMQDPARTSETTVLYLHGGAYYLCDPATHRSFTVRLAQESKGRVCSVRYRLAPQTAFPGQLIDSLLVYLSLMYPPEGAIHEAVPAEKIVFAGDSAGGHLSFCLLQLLLQLHRSSDGVPVVKFHGRDVHVPLPAGASANSGWLDIARAMPSIARNARWDYLPFADHSSTIPYPKEAGVWPTDPPRGDLFCDLSALDHPLVALLLADWTNAPPLWMNTGEEMLTDEDVLVATRAAQAGVTVHFEQYEAMPHCFGLLIQTLPQSNRMMKSWGEWLRRVVAEPATLKTNGTWVPAPYKGKAGEKQIDVLRMESVGIEEATRLIRQAKKERIAGYGDGTALPKPTL